MLITRAKLVYNNYFDKISKRFKILSNMTFRYFKLKYFISALFCAVFLFFVNPVKAEVLSNFVPVPEFDLEQNAKTSDLEISGQAINFSSVELILDNISLGNAQAKIGTLGWQDWQIELPSNLMFGLHKLEAITKYYNYRSATSTLEFQYSPKFPAPTLFNPVLNSATNFTQPWIVGLTHSPAILSIYIDDQLDGELSIDSEKEIIDFKYKPKQKLQNGFHTVKVIAKSLENLTSDWSNEIIFEVRQNLTKMVAPDLPSETGNFIPPVPAPTLIEPKNGAVQKSGKLIISGLIHNEHVIQFYLDEELLTEFLPPGHESGVTSFTWYAPENLLPGHYKIYAKAINPRGQISGKSNILNLLILPPEYFVSQGPAGIVAAGKDDNKIDNTNIIADHIDETVAQVSDWSKKWQWLIGGIILLAIFLLITWILINKKKVAKKNSGDQIKISHESTPEIQGPEIKYNIGENQSFDDTQDNSPDDELKDPAGEKDQKLDI